MDSLEQMLRLRYCQTSLLWLSPPFEKQGFALMGCGETLQPCMLMRQLMGPTLQQVMQTQSRCSLQQALSSHLPDFLSAHLSTRSIHPAQEIEGDQRWPCLLRWGCCQGLLDWGRIKIVQGNPMRAARGSATLVTDNNGCGTHSAQSPCQKT